MAILNVRFLGNLVGDILDQIKLIAISWLERKIIERSMCFLNLHIKEKYIKTRVEFFSFASVVGIINRLSMMGRNGMNTDIFDDFPGYFIYCVSLLYIRDYMPR